MAGRKIRTRACFTARLQPERVLLKGRPQFSAAGLVCPLSFGEGQFLEIGDRYHGLRLHASRPASTRLGWQRVLPGAVEAPLCCVGLYWTRTWATPLTQWSRISTGHQIFRRVSKGFSRIDAQTAFINAVD